MRWLSDRWLAIAIGATAVLDPAYRLALHLRYHHAVEYTFAPARADALAAGAAIALLLKHRPRLRAAAWPTWAIALGIGAVLARLAWARGALIGYPMFAACGYTAVAAAWAAVVMWAATRSGGRDGACRILRWGPLQRVGTLSYVIYLVHFGLLGAVVAAMPRAPHLAAAAVALLLSFAVAEVSWRYFESPILALKSRAPFFFLRRRAAVAAAD